MFCPRCHGQGCWYCQNLDVATGTHYTYAAVLNRKREETLAFIQQHIAQHGQITTEEALLQMVEAAIRYGKESVRAKEAKEREEPKENRFGFLEWEAREEEEKRVYTFTQTLDLEL